MFDMNAHQKLIHNLRHRYQNFPDISLRLFSSPAASLSRAPGPARRGEMFISKPILKCSVAFGEWLWQAKGRKSKLEFYHGTALINFPIR